jgi:hypothetical protein
MNLSRKDRALIELDSCFPNPRFQDSIHDNPLSTAATPASEPDTSKPSL